MKIGIVSDTHRNKDMLASVFEWLVSNQHIVSLYHLGDDYEDLSDIVDDRIEIIQVPGIYNPRYRDGSLSVKKVDNVLVYGLCLFIQQIKILQMKMRH